MSAHAGRLRPSSSIWPAERPLRHTITDGRGRRRRSDLAGLIAGEPLVRRVRLDPGQVSADPRSRRRRTLHPAQRALPIPELAQASAIYAYSFILTKLDVSAPDKAAAAEHWYRHRTTIENLFRDSKHGAVLRHLRISPGQYRLDVGRAAGRHHGRLAAPAHRHHPRPGHHSRSRRARLAAGTRGRFLRVREGPSRLRSREPGPGDRGRLPGAGWPVGAARPTGGTACGQRKRHVRAAVVRRPPAQTRRRPDRGDRGGDRQPSDEPGDREHAV